MQYNFAIAGCGRVSHRHAEQISRIGNVNAVCDIIPQRANILAGQYHATPYYSFGQLLESGKNIDKISICTPNGLHPEHSIQSLNAGKHIICEKPLCIHSADGFKMIKVPDTGSSRGNDKTWRRVYE